MPRISSPAGSRQPVGRCVDRNVRTSGIGLRGELDLIALDGPALVFVEVKARRTGSSAGPETPALAVGPRKQAKIRSLAAAWLRERGYDVPRHRDLRFDVVGYGSTEPARDRVRAHRAAF